MNGVREFGPDDWQKPEPGWQQGKVVAGTWSEGGMVKFSASGTATKDGGAIVQLEIGLRAPQEGDYTIVARSRLTGAGDELSAKVEAIVTLPVVAYAFVIRWVSDYPMQTNSLTAQPPQIVANESLINVYAFSNGGPVWTIVAPSVAAKCDVTGHAAGSLSNGWMELVLSTPAGDKSSRYPLHGLAGGYATVDGVASGIVANPSSPLFGGPQFRASLKENSAAFSELQLQIKGAP